MNRAMIPDALCKILNGPELLIDSDSWSILPRIKVPPT